MAQNKGSVKSDMKLSKKAKIEKKQTWWQGSTTDDNSFMRLL